MQIPMHQSCLVAVLAGLSLLMSGCNTAPKKDPEYAPVKAVEIPPRPMGNGSIYQMGYETSWFEDLRARRVGDILIVNLVEETDGEISNTTEVKKSNTTSITNPTILGSPLNFKRPGVIGGSGNLDLGTSLASSTNFKGEGDAEQNNSLNGSLSVMVTDVLPNGYLKVRGEKRIGLNGGNEYVKVSGIVRPTDIDTNNSVSSTKIADATIVYVGDGQVANANIMGWLAKFFISALVPF